jgi:hypothetical protein
MVAAYPTITSKRSQLSTSSWDSEEVPWIPPSPPSLRNSTAIRKFAENATPLFPWRLPTAEKESADTATNLDSKRNPKIDPHLLFKPHLSTAAYMTTIRELSEKDSSHSAELLLNFE